MGPAGNQDIDMIFPSFQADVIGTSEGHHWRGIG